MLPTTMNLPNQDWRLLLALTSSAPMSSPPPPPFPRIVVPLRSYAVMYTSLLIPWSPNPTPSETLYRASNLVRTQGTIFLLPPSPPILRNTYNVPPRPQSRMSSGAVALCKHFERSGSVEHGVAHPFWTLPRGSNEEKTRIAGEILEAMLADVAWRNVMMLHEGVAVYEVRNRKGYGMRWTLDLQGKSSCDEDVDAGKNSDEREDVKREETSRTTNEYTIKKVAFRGFVEPTAGLNHELNRRDAV